MCSLCDPCARVPVCPVCVPALPGDFLSVLDGDRGRLHPPGTAHALPATRGDKGGTISGLTSATEEVIHPCVGLGS